MSAKADRRYALFGGLFGGLLEPPVATMPSGCTLRAKAGTGAQ